ncbi:MAG: MoaD/ThiS family protein [Ardenticatenales bacterium]|nr:MoaD/ThiS family protein [Ardenticatenales bacterium]
MPTIRIPTPLRPYAGNNSTVFVSGSTVGTALDNLTQQFPALRQHLFNGDALRSFVNVFLNQEDVRFLDGLQTQLAENDTLIIIPSIAGGACSEWFILLKARPRQVRHVNFGPAPRTNPSRQLEDIL